MAEPAKDYRALLQKYLAYVQDVEGADFVTISERRYESDVAFDESEWDELSKLSDGAHYLRMDHCSRRHR